MSGIVFSEMANLCSYFVQILYLLKINSTNSVQNFTIIKKMKRVDAANIQNIFEDNIEQENRPYLL